MARVEITIGKDDPNPDRVVVDLVISEKNLKAINRDYEAHPELVDSRYPIMENAVVIMNGEVLEPWEGGVWSLRIESDEKHYSDERRGEAKEKKRLKK